MVEYPPCKKCGKSHGMGIETMATGEIEPLDLCYDCLWSGLEFKPITEQVVLKDDMAANLKYLENILLGFNENG